ncbi:Peroxisomal membrane protein 4 [Geodia barretti]|uniref:Peroxisomal membrane protein 4 n=1 Tax=Geodia barretti TaxID=519541 RepID=A0AA35S6L8_GEOBA|nr:Peroxisomal membrane protein 4 [Geodia barretti]
MAQAVLQNPKYKWLFEVVKGFRNGLVYGVKIRLPHSLVMTFLFHEGSLQEKLHFILNATFQHARNLAILTALYKALTLALQRIAGRAVPGLPAITGAVCGYLVFGTETKINMQINLYLLSRVTMALVRLARQQGWLPSPSSLSASLSPFPLFAALMWGLVMWLYENHLPLLQPSLQVLSCPDHLGEEKGLKDPFSFMDTVTIPVSPNESAQPRIAQILFLS